MSKLCTPGERVASSLCLSALAWVCVSFCTLSAEALPVVPVTPPQLYWHCILQFKKQTHTHSTVQYRTPLTAFFFAVAEM